MIGGLAEIPGNQSEIALFLVLAIGYAVGQIRFGPIQLGGICGTLIAALVVGAAGRRCTASSAAAGSGPQFGQPRRRGNRHRVLPGGCRWRISTNTTTRTPGDRCGSWLRSTLRCSRRRTARVP
ncbi:hypothetical protein [Variovorax guangxiensis]|uniref:aspartate-alanine antiporter-like transporter n=1 Tax=Variovorax guangxiensis TaxID=1775474 RepID=UPI003B83371D